MFVGVDGRSRYQYNWDTNNIAPRLGLSYQEQKTVVRAATATSSGRRTRARRARSARSGSAPRTCGSRRSTASRRSTRCENPYPNGFVPSPGSSQGLLTQAGANLQAPLQDTPSPWTIQFNVNVQRELPWARSSRSPTWARAATTCRRRRGRLSLNQLDPQYMSLGSQLNQQVPNPFFGIVNNGVLTQPTVAAGSCCGRIRSSPTSFRCYAGAKSLQRAADHRAQAAVAGADVRGLPYAKPRKSA